MRSGQSLKYLVILVVVAIVGAFFLGSRMGSEKGREDARLEEGIAASKVIEATFGTQSKFVAAEMRGRVLARSSDPGFVKFLRSDQRMVAPFTVAYTVDLDGIESRDMRWNSENRIVYVELPGIVVEPVNVDESKKETRRSGIWVTEKASGALHRRGSAAAQSTAQKLASESRYVAKAEQNAREKLNRLLSGPLEAAGMRDVRVMVRFPTDGGKSDQRWDVSRSIEAVLAERKALAQ